jgi:hypothetical protein
MNNKIIGLVLLVVGVAMLYFGYQRYNSVGSEVVRALGGTPTNETMILLIGGGVVLVIGLVLAVRR